MYKHLHVIVNPASGSEKPVLSIFNSAFGPAGIDWDVFVTKGAGDARRFAKQAVEEGVDALAVYGGDGTVREALSGLVGTHIPLAIFPGGTGNGASTELGIPSDLAAACALVSGEDHDIRRIDLGQMGDDYFALNVGVGFPTAMMQGADHATKDRLGVLAYLVAGIQTLRDPPVARYHLTLDKEKIESEGVTCLVANSGTLGNSGIKLAPTIDVDDGLLDVIVIRQSDLGALVSLAASLLQGNEDAPALQHWQAREIELVTDPQQPLQMDGDVAGKTPFKVKVLPQSAHIIVPKRPASPST